MIERLQRIATFLHRFRLLLVALGVVGFGVFALSLFENPWLDGEIWMTPGLIAFSWALALYSLLALFQQIPAKVDKSEGWRKRLSVSIRRGALWLIGLALIVLSGSLFYFSYLLIRVWG